MVVVEQDIEDPEHLRSATIEAGAGSNSHATNEDLSLLEDELLGGQYVELQLESLCRTDEYLKVTRVLILNK